MTPTPNDNATVAPRAQHRAVQDAAPPLFLPLASSPPVTGMSVNTARRRHSDALAAGQDGFLLKVGRTTMVDMRAFQAFMARQPRAVFCTDRPTKAAA